MKRKIVLWGYPLGSDTLSYVWYGFYKAFMEMGYPVYWLHDGPQNFDFDFSNCIFIAEAYQTKYLPCNKTSTYLIHTCTDADVFRNLGAGRVIDMRYNCFFQDHPVNYKYHLDHFSTTPLGPEVYYEQESSSKCEAIYISWATDLLPSEINENNIGLPRRNIIYFIGTRYNTGDKYSNSEEMNILQQFCGKHKLEFQHIDPWLNPVDMDTNRKLIQEAYLAPDIRGKQNIDCGYIPCRIYKNISYGQLGITNSLTVHDSMKRSTIYHPYLKDLLEIALNYKDDKLRIAAQMDIVRRNHTFVQRIEALEKLWI